jgi:tetratricopeptide (TPR) repeat protein
MVYVAMEYVEGVTLDRWLSAGAGPRPQRSVLDLMIGAGRGIAAAHAVGLVHRDFKPQNVFVSTTDVAKVGDFGLVRVERGDAVAGVPATSELVLTLSVAGSVVGTPAYMAPEQLRGELATEASDQFSFCVTLYEALYGKRPYAGTTIEALLAAIKAGVAFPATPRVPRQIRAALARGLALDPSARFATMTALLERLAHRRHPVRWAALGGGVAAAAIATTLAFGSTREGAVCSGSERELAGVWDPERRAAVAAAFRATGAEHADDVATRTAAILDRQRTQWVAGHRGACEATRVRKTETEDILALRTSCLAQKRSELRALTDLFVRADKEIVGKAIDAAAHLEGVAQCADVPALKQVVRPPADPAQRAQVDKLRDQLAALRATGRMRKIADAVTEARALAEATDKLGYAPLHAGALAELGGLLHDAGSDDEAIRVLRKAAAAADAAADDRTRFDAVERWIMTLVYTRRVDQLEDALEQARGILERIPYDAGMQHRLLILEGNTLVAQKKPEAAVEKFRALIAAYEKILAPDDPQLGTSWTYLADALARQGGKDDEVVAATKHAREIFARAYGAGHATQKEAQSDEYQAALFQGMMLVDQKKAAEALPVIEPALAKLAQLHGPDHDTVGMGSHMLGMAYHDLGRLADARFQHERALDIHMRTYGADNIKTAASHLELGKLDYDQRHYERAVEHFLAARASFAKLRGDNALQAIVGELWATRALIGAGRLDDATKHIAHVRAVGGEFGNSPQVFVLEAEIAIDRGKPAQALALLDKAFKLPPGRGEWIGRAELMMGRALVRAGDKKKALVHAERAVAELEKRGKKVDAAEARELVASLTK